MPGKSKRKKFKPSPSKQPVAAQTSPSTASPPAVSKSSSAPVKNTPAAGKQASAQHVSDAFKYLGTEMKVTSILTAIILVIIFALFFILR